jgi:hypothetical protein
MTFSKLFVVALTLAGCSKGGPKDDTLPFARQLGESTKSPGANASKPAPLTPDDPRVMNVSASITPQQQQRAATTPAPTPAPQPTRTEATSSTPVQPPTDIAPPSTTTETNRPGVFSPPPPPPQ